MHLLVIEDDPRLSRLLKRLLEDDRHVVELATDGRTGLEIAEDAPGIECVILDIGLPDMSGLDVARRLRDTGVATPILMLTARDTIGDRVSGLDAGADDYLVKPFAFEELSARLRAMGRRGAPAGRRTQPTLVSGPIALDETARRVTVDGALVDLSPREFSLLECLLRHAGQTLAVRRGRHSERGGRVYPLPPRQARLRRAVHPDGPGGRLPTRRWLRL